MRSCARLACSVVVTLLLTTLVHADLPSHCLKWQVLGTWDFKVSATESGSPLCGHTQPDNIVNVYEKKLGYSNPGFSVAATGNFTLLSNYSNSATLCFPDSCEAATWTMVYDEGFSIKGTTSGFELFLQFVYVPKARSLSGRYPDPKRASKWNTYCDRTYPGWFAVNRTSRGCAVAKNRVSQNPSPSVALMSTESSDTLVQIRSGLRTALSDAFSHEFMQQRAFNFEKLEEKASLINQRQKFWVADASSAEFARDFANGEVFRSVGGTREKLLKPKSYSLDDIVDPQARAKEAKRRQCIRSVLPPSLDWSNNTIATTAVINQGSCGSCYAVSSTDSMTARLRLKKQSSTLAIRSYQAILDCSATNQGCDGGFPWLVAQYAHLEGLVTDACMASPSVDPSDKCLFSSAECTNNVEFARDWGYVGGYYGRGNTEDMMWSLFRDGPLVVAVNAKDDMFLYRSGLFVARPPDAGEEEHHKEAYWELTTHAVSLVGYGSFVVEGTDIESWKIKNSWGTGWGDNGYFNIQRGVDAMAVESMPVHAIFDDGKPGNPDFESYVRSKLSQLNDNECTTMIEAMLAQELV